MRTAAGLAADYTAALLGVDRARISAMEFGQRTITPERLRTLACNCEVADEAYVDALVEMAKPAGRQWWDRYRGHLPPGLLDIAELEAHARRMRTAFSMHMPGLLQTSDHSLAVFRMVIPALPSHEIALRLAHRAERQQILDGDDAPEYTALVHEAALRMKFGGRTVARQQLGYLLAQSERENVHLRVLTFEAGAFPGAGQNVFYAEGPVPQLDTVQLDSAHGPDFLHADTQLSKYRAHLDLMEELALSREDSRDFIRNVLSEL